MSPLIPMANMWSSEGREALGQALGNVILLITLITAAVSFLLFVAVEGYVMRACQWGSLRQSITDAAISNIVCVVIGASILFTLSVRPLLTSFIPVLLITWLWSLLVKGAWLLLTRRHSVLQALRTALYANTVSYGVWGVLFAIGYSPKLL